jgi:hypothetical protein
MSLKDSLSPDPDPPMSDSTDRPWERRRDDDDPDRRERERGRDRDDDYEDRPRRRRPYDGRPPGSESNGLAVTGLVLGILGLCTGCLTGVPAIVCSALALQRPAGRGMAITGLILGGIGTLMTVAAVFLLPMAVQKIREAASRQADSNNLKAITLSTLTHNDRTDALPPADGNLSWRVEILPYLEQDRLYQRFDRIQTWDGPNNRALANTVIKEYRSTLDPAGEAGTRYRVFVGPETLYQPGKPPVRLTEVSDGTSNTIFAIEAADTVPWPQPKEFTYNPRGPLPALGHPQRTGSIVLASTLDGSVKVLKNPSEQLLRAAITPNGKEPTPADW